MANTHRGEIAAKIDGRDWRLCLTLGALAELENRMKASDISALASRFSSGKLSAEDIINIIVVGLRGAGHDVEDDEVRDMQCEGGITGFGKIVSDLLAATFGVQQTQDSETDQKAISPNPL